jgi:hypothetical protein
MDLRTGRTYETPEEARAAGVPDADLARLVRSADGSLEPRFTPPTTKPRFKFTKGSFKLADVVKR